MNVALTTQWEDFIKQLIGAGRYRNAGEVVRAALRELREKEREVFPAGSLKHLYDPEHNEAETKLLRRLPVPEPDEV
jgi:putative addiction module CopG family antidote